MGQGRALFRVADLMKLAFLVARMPARSREQRKEISAAQIIVIDSDQGESGASASWREGFQRLVPDVGMGRAGIVMGLDVSRLARIIAGYQAGIRFAAVHHTCGSCLTHHTLPANCRL